MARGETNTRERDWADIWRLTGSHDLKSETLTAALLRTAAHREVPIQPLTPRLGELVSLRSGSYRTWRQRQGPDASAYPADLQAVIDEVTSFADPLLTGATRGHRWDGSSRRWLDRQ
jgi:hypothetical protein